MLLNYKNTVKGIDHSILRINSVDGETLEITAEVLSEAGNKIDLGEYNLYALYQPASDFGITNDFKNLAVSVDNGNAVITWTADNQIEGTSDYKIWLKAEKTAQ